MDKSNLIRKKLIEDYWISKLRYKNDITISMPGQRGKGYAVDSITVDEPVNDRIRQIAKGNVMSEYAVYLSFYAILLEKYFSLEEAVIASPDIHTPGHSAVKEHVLFFNLPIDAKDTLPAVLKKSGAEIQETVQYAGYDWQQLRETLIGLAANPDHLFKFGFRFAAISEISAVADAASLTLIIDRSTDGHPVCSFRYDKVLFEAQFINQLSRHYSALLQYLLHDLTLPIHAYAVLDKNEKQRILEQFNDSGCDFPGEKTIVRLFEEQVLRTPEATAILFEGDQLSYNELNIRANRLANYLRSEFNIGRETLIGISLEPSIELMIGIMGILKAGAAYVPVDPAYPDERKAYLVQDSRMKLLLTNEHQVNSSYEVQTLQVNDPAIYAASALDPIATCTPNDLMYVIYTSGTTGKPKGVQVENRSVVNFITWVKRVLYDPCASPMVCMLTASVNFDASVKSLFTPLISGAALLLTPDKKRKDALLYIEQLRRYKVNITDITPGYLRVLLSVLKENNERVFVNYILVGGEPLSRQLVNDHARLFEPGSKLMNMYGPTEATVDATSEIIGTGLSVDGSIGKPLANMKMYILDEFLQPVPVGVKGELYIGGVGVARGYLFREELNKERFINNPFAKGRLFKTGDIGYWQWDGGIAFCGRNDNQVKIRGYRIEPGEIESCILRNKEIEAAVVIARPDAAGENRLIAYLISNAENIVATVRHQLQEVLPVYLVPDYFLVLDKLPFTNSGKVNRNALPDPGPLYVAREYAAPRTATEQQLVNIWQQVLELERIGINDNFFEIGGHSLKAMRIIAAIAREMGAHIELRSLFLHPTIAGLSTVIPVSVFNRYSPVVPVPMQEHYPVSHAQRRLWILDQLEKKQVAYNIPAAYRLTGPLDLLAFQRTFLALVNRHEVLRTRFAEVNGELRQFVCSIDDIGFKVVYADLSEYPDGEERAAVIANTEALKTFDLKKGPLLSASLLRLQEQEHIFIITLHHIISDEWSTGVLIDEVVHLYRSFSKGITDPLPPLRIQYRDYAVWQKDELSGPSAQVQRAYWLNRFRDDIPVLELPCDYSRPAVKTYNGFSYSFRLTAETAHQLQMLGRREGASLFMVLLSTIQVLLHRYTGQEDIILGTPVAGRMHKDLENQIGCYANTMALRNAVQRDWSFEELLNHIKENILAAYEHQDYPFDRLVDQLNLQRDTSRSPLFNVMVVLQTREVNNWQQSDSIPGVVVDRYEALRFEISKFDLLFSFTEDGNGIAVQIEYNSDLFKTARIEQMAGHYTRLVNSIITNADFPIGELAYMGTEETNGLLQLHTTSLNYPADKTIITLFEEQVLRTPDAIALKFENTLLTYAQLNEKANQLAHYLCDNYEVGKEELVGICMERSAEMVIAILGTLKTGAGYVPVDPAYPTERKRLMTHEAGITVLITDAYDTKTNASSSSKSPVWHWSYEHLQNSSKENLPIISGPDNICYIIYTSGSTGKPKGVMVNNRNVVNLLSACMYHYRINSSDVWTLFHSICFDFSVWEMFGCLSTGGKLIVVSRPVAYDTAAFANLLVNEKVTILNQVPTMFAQVSKCMLSNTSQPELALRYVIFGGEALNPGMLRGWKNRYPGTALINMYGITETTVHTTYKEITEEEIVTGTSNIGVPLPNVKIYIMDSSHNLLPMGIAGEIVVGGAGVTRGYLNTPELNEARFIVNPYDQNEKLYCSGDMGIMTENGEVIYKGRNDNQIKIRGYRIGITEIERRLLEQPLVKEAVVVAQQDPAGIAQLVAYVVVDEPITVKALRSHLAEQLPDYMLPSRFVQLASLPVTTNGKIDKKQLFLLPEISMGTGREFVPAQTELQQQLVTVWEQVLGKTEIGIHDNFFELGGDSISVIQIVSRARQQGIVLEPYDVLHHPTIATLADQARNAVSGQAEQGSLTGSAPLLPVQQWFFEKQYKEISHYNQAVLLGVDKGISYDDLDVSIKAIIDHHDVLRFRYNQAGERWSQEYGSVNEAMQTVDLTGHEVHTLTAAIADICGQYQQSLDIFKGILIKTVLIRTPSFDNYNRLFIVIHHLAVDGVSWRILLNDLSEHLQSPEKMKKIYSTPKTSSYREWGSRLLEYAQTTAVTAQLSYWENIVANATGLSVEQVVPVVDRKEVTGISVELLPEFTKLLLHDTNRAYQTGIDDILLAALAQTIGNWRQQSKVVIALEGHGRENNFNEIDLTQTIGWFTSLYPVLLDHPQAAATGELIKSIKEQLRTIPHKGMGYGLLRYLHPSQEVRKRLDKKEPFDLVFNYLGQLDHVVNAAGGKLVIAGEPAGDPISPANAFPHKLVINSSITNGKLVLSWNYATSQYKEQTIRLLSTNFIENLTAIILHCSSRNYTEHTPSDFGLQESLSYSELDSFLQKGKDLEDILTV